MERQGIKEQGINKETGEILIKIDPFTLDEEVSLLKGNNLKAKKLLNWVQKQILMN